MLYVGLFFPRMLKSAMKKMSNVLSDCSPFKIALVQLGNVGFNKTANLAHAREKILEAAKNGAQVIVLPVNDNSFSRLYLLKVFFFLGMFQLTLRS